MSDKNNEQDFQQNKLEGFQNSLYDFENLKEHTDNFNDLTIKKLAWFIEKKTNNECVFNYRKTPEYIIGVNKSDLELLEIQLRNINKSIEYFLDDLKLSLVSNPLKSVIKERLKE
jgi:hypothetical protein